MTALLFGVYIRGPFWDPLVRSLTVKEGAIPHFLCFLAQMIANIVIPYIYIYTRIHMNTLIPSRAIVSRTSNVPENNIGSY